MENNTTDGIRGKAYRIAVIADIHANLPALEAALREAESYKPDKIVFLGDFVGGGAYPEEVVSLVSSIKNAVFVRGNHDNFAVSDFVPIDNGDIKRRMFIRQQKQLSGASKKFLRGLEFYHSFTVFGKQIVCVHYPRGKGGRFKDLIYLPTEEQVKELFSGMNGDIFLFGHEHTGSTHEIGGKFYLNFGTCGNYLFPDTARFGIVEIEGDKVGYKSINAHYDESVPKQKTEKLIAELSR